MSATPIGDEFEKFIAMVAARPLDDDEKKSLRWAFFAGAHAIFETVMQTCAEGETEASQVGLAILDAELQAFQAGVMREAAETGKAH